MQIRFLILLLAAVLAVSCRKKAVDPGKPSCPVSDSVRKNYSESALQMILRHYYDNKEFLSGYSDGKFSREQQEEILGYIQSVYDLDIPNPTLNSISALAAGTAPQDVYTAATGYSASRAARRSL